MIQPSDLFFTKLRPTATIPQKRLEDVGYDVYADFEEDFIVIYPHKIAKIPTGIASAFHHSKGIILKERGSTGTINMTQKSGVIDSGYRGEWFIPIANDNDTTLIISKLGEQETLQRAFGEIAPSDIIFYPYHKAIAQAVVIDVPVMNVAEVSKETLELFGSERGSGALGSSGK